MIFHYSSLIKIFIFFILLFKCEFLIASNQDILILLHGLARHHSSMRFYEKEMQDSFDVYNLDYASRQLSLDECISVIKNEVHSILKNHSDHKVHFIAHSMGGLIAIAVWDSLPKDQQGIIITLGTPYQGSPALNFISEFSQFQKFYGPVLSDLKNINQEKLILTGAKPICFYGVDCPFFLNFFGWLYPKNERHDCLVSERSACFKNSLKNIELIENHESMLKNEEVVKKVKNTLAEAIIASTNA